MQVQETKNVSGIIIVQLAKNKSIWKALIEENCREVAESLRKQDFLGLQSIVS